MAGGQCVRRSVDRTGIQTIENRHLTIHEDKIDTFRCQQIEHLLAIACRDHIQPHSFKLGPGHDQVAFVILGEQNPAPQSPAFRHRLHADTCLLPSERCLNNTKELGLAQGFGQAGQHFYPSRRQLLAHVGRRGKSDCAYPRQSRVGTQGTHQVQT